MSNKLSKTISKNKMKLKLASEMQIGHQKKEEFPEDGLAKETAKHQDDSRELKARKKIQLPLKISKALDSSRLPKS